MREMAVHGHQATPEATDFVLSCLEQGYEVHGVRDGAMRVFHESSLRLRHLRTEQGPQRSSPREKGVHRGSSREARRD